MSSPVQNSTSTKNYGGEEFPEDGEFPDDYYHDMPEGEVDVYWTPPEEGAGVAGGAGPLSQESLMAQIQDLLTQEISDGQKRGLERLLSKVQAAGNNPQKLSALESELHAKIDEIYPPEQPPATEGDAGVDGEGAAAEGDGSLLSEMQKLREKIVADPAFEGKETNRDKLLKDLDSMIANAELHQDDETYLGMLEDKFYALSEEYVNRSLNADSGKAQDLADQLGVSVDEVVSAAESAGVDLKNPQAGDKLMKMLQALGVPSPDDLTNFNNLRDKRTQAIKDLNLQADQQTAQWRMDSEQVPDVGLWRQLYEFYSGTDAYKPRMNETATKMGNALTAALGALGLASSAGSEPGRINIGGVEYDFLSEDSGTYKLDTVMDALTDPSYSPAPRNTEAGDYYSDQAGNFWEGVGHKSAREGGDGYPTVTFSSG